MADIQIVYRDYYCYCDRSEHCMQCHTEYAKDVGCSSYNDGEAYIIREDGDIVIPFGDCWYAKTRHKYKGMSVKKYEIEPSKYAFNPWFNCMLVRTGKNEYECDKVILDGECIYNNLTDNVAESPS